MLLPGAPFHTTDPSLKDLPVEYKGKWGLYAIVYEKPGYRSRVYFGCSTPILHDLTSRINCYDNGSSLPEYVAKSLEEGFEITHKGVLCWVPKPAGGVGPMPCLLICALEYTLTYMLWAMWAKKGDYGMGHICLWNRTAPEYDGLCFHPASWEEVPAKFDLTPEELVQQAAYNEQRRLDLKVPSATDYHHK